MPCFYCNADSDELRYFLILFIGGLCISSFLIGMGLVLRGHFKDTEGLADTPLRIEQEEEELLAEADDSKLKAKTDNDR